jgi:CBS domain containing-hemolysin-like protein
MQIHVFNEKFDDELTSIHSDTVAGYITEHLSRIPKRGDCVHSGKYILTITNIRKNRLVTILVEPVIKEDIL